jgi:hypothetical protein
VNALEKDASEVLSLVQFIKNSFEPINRVSPDVLSLIPDYLGQDPMDECLIAMTHVCRRWRDVFTSRASLWTLLDFASVEKTRVYIQRSKSSPLKLLLEDLEGLPFSDDAFPLVIPHLHRIKSVEIFGDFYFTSDVFEHFHSHALLLEELKIQVSDNYKLDLDNGLFNGDPSSLRKLYLYGVITDLPWKNKNLTNLRACTFEFSTPGFGITQLLDFFESAPLLHTIELWYPIPSSSDAPPERIVPLLLLKTLHIKADSAHSILLNHLSIPTGASLIQESKYTKEYFPLLDHPPGSSPNLSNLSHITAINLHFNESRKSLRLTGPSGGLRVTLRLDTWYRDFPDVDRCVLRSLDSRFLSTTRRLSFSEYDHPNPARVNKCPVFQTLSLTRKLRTLILVKCDNTSFIHALNPAKNPSNLLLCPNLKRFKFYIKSFDKFSIYSLIDMAKNRSSKGGRLLSIAIVGLGELKSGEDVLELRKYAAHVEYKIDIASPAWDDLLGAPGSNEGE